MPQLSLYSLAVVSRPDLPPKAETLAKIESGQLEYIDFPATVFQNGPLRNPYAFRDEDIEAFAASFEGKPFLRNHDEHNIESRDGTILTSQMEGKNMKQTIRLTTRKGMTAFIEGQIDRFSIGWFPPEDIQCSICNSNWLSCAHMPGKKYKVGNSNKTCLLVMVKPEGKECSAVNAPASEGTGLLSALEQYKLEIDSRKADDQRASRVNQSTKGVLMKKKVKVKAEIPDADGVLQTVEVEGEPIGESPIQAQLSANAEAAAELLGAHQLQQQMDAQLAQSEETLAALSGNLLETSLANSKLPPIVQDRIKRQYQGKAFKPTELALTIKEAREEVAALLDAQNIAGPGRHTIGGMITGVDQFKLAYADLLGLPREAGQENTKVARLSGIREAYILGTGDSDLRGGYYPSFALASADFPGITADLLNNILTNAWKDYEEAYGWWQKIATVEHFTSLRDVKWLKTGTIGSLPTVNERGEYTQLPIGDNKETSVWYKYGGYMGFTLEDMINDDVRALKRLPQEAALGGMRNISEQVAAIFTANSGAGPAMADGGNLFNATAVTTLGGHANLLTTALGTDYTAWKAISKAMYNQPLLVKNATGKYGTGKKQAIRPRFCLVPVDLEDQANALFLPRWEAQAQNVAAVSATFGGRVEPIVVPEWTDATDYAAVADPKYVPSIMIGEIFGVKPQVFSASSEMDPAMFANDECRIKVRQFLNVGVADWRGLHKSNV